MTTTDKLQQKLTIAASSDIGSVRKENEDFYYYSQSKSFLVVCDGMGGHQKGALASKYGGETMRDLIFGNESVKKISIENKLYDTARACEDLPTNVTAEALKLAAGIRLANRRIFQAALQDKKMLGMGTTIVAAIFHEGHIVVAHVGDSRLYRLRGSELSTITTDHSWLNELLEDNEISENEVKNFRKKNVLTRALGIAPSVKIDLQIAPVEPDDLYLMCSDGLSNALQDELIHSILSAYHGSLQNKVSNLVSRAKMMDGSDNITAGLAHVAGQWEMSEQTDASWTIGEEPAHITDYIDQCIKSIYPQTGAGNGKGSRRLGIFGLAAAVVVALAFFVFQSSTAERRPPEAGASPLFTQQANSSDATQARQTRQVSRVPAGQIALLQISDDKYLKMFNDLQGVRVLDVVARFAPNKPVTVGNYTWAMADSRETILYKKRNIYLEPVTAASDAGAGFGTSTGKQTEGSRQQTGANALIYLLGDFNATPFDRASILVNDRPLGALNRYKDSGFYLDNGIYDIKIVDRSNNVLKEKNNIQIQNGETIAIEF